MGLRDTTPEMRPVFLLSASETADQYIAHESLKLLSVFSTAGGWIIGALILAAIFWKAGEERWKAYIPVYNTVTFFRIASLPGALALLPYGAILVYLLGSVMFVIAPAVGVAFYLVGFAAFIAAAVLQVMATYRVGLHLGHAGAGWILLAIFLPFVSLIIFAADRSIWRDDEELGWDAGKIATEVPRYMR